ncbi:EAL domain-containing protein [Sphingomonas sp. CJ20]
MRFLSNLALSEMQSLLDAIPNPVMLKRPDHSILMANQSACDMIGYPREVVLSPGAVLASEELLAIYNRADDIVFATGCDHENEEDVVDRNGRVRRMITHKRRVHIGGKPALVALFTDVTDVREAEARSRYLAFHDPLTGLPNRSLLNERVDQAVLRTRRSRTRCALLYVDLDRFKEVNDSYGHASGDALLRDFSARLASIARASDTVARIGGDEFAVLLTDIGDQFDPADISARILAAATEPFEIEGAQVYVGASIGVAIVPDGGTCRDELHRMADVALYHAKNAGKARAETFSPQLDSAMRRRAQIERDLRVALATGEGLDVHYQPVVDNTGETVRSMEALVRWDHPTLGELTPTEFVPIAEETGLIVALGEWVLARAARMMAVWTGVPVAVNVSAVQLRADDIVERLLAIIDDAGLARAQLHVEITETALFDSGDAGSDKLRRLRESGVKIVLDDFGTGYSSLSHLQKLSIDRVKIDQSFVSGVVEAADSRAIIQAVLCMSKALGVAVTAEGVESDAQFRFLRDSGCSDFQGYLFSRPLPERAARAYLANAGISARAA